MTVETTLAAEPVCPAGPQSRVLSVPCPLCHVTSGEVCVKTTSGEPARTVHAVRIDEANWMFRTRQMWFVLRDDDPRFDLKAGDILRCVNYPYDAKVSVLFREWDGFDPDCNQYDSDVAFLGFVPRDMAVPE